ncbi:MAG: alpha/beta hydrolase [Paraglaciecola sp.]|uniref:alpha/beta hydrolase n=1 Tax=Paraglaciecola sp. TaxID=1920173 RepID=UPI00273EE571|nr:alpha/beta hydrolase [Paraglaciecola sp.]MDP5029030.1 alpha/beta hydrolase [Paraglaciecola sp.]MDP5133104.1 alpha/beta hydrolase [Paraglaciecola sp.]
MKRIMATHYHSLFILLFAGFMCDKALSANTSYPQDLRYSVQSSFMKYQNTYPELRIAQINVEDKVHITANHVYSHASGRELTMDIMRPTTQRNGRAVLLIHGGGWGSGHKTHMHQLAKALALRGYVSACLEYRLSPEAAFPAAIEDIYQGIRWLSSQSSTFNFNKNQISLLGGSSGGHLASLVAYSAEHNVFIPNSNAYQVNAVVNLDGVLDVASGEGLLAEDKNGNSDSALARWLGGRFADKTALWQQVSIPQYITNQSPSLLFISSGQSRFKAGFKDLERRLLQHGKRARLVTLEHAPHPFWLFDPWLSGIVEPIDAFLQALP